MGAAVVAGGAAERLRRGEASLEGCGGVDASPVLKAAEHVLDAVALSVEHPVVRDRHLVVGFRGDARFDATLGQGLSQPVGVIAPVAEQDLGLGERVDQQGGTPIIAHLAFAQQQDQRSALAIAHGVELRVQAAFGPPDTSGSEAEPMIRGIIGTTRPFFKRLAAVRFAFR